MVFFAPRDAKGGKKQQKRGKDRRKEGEYERVVVSGLVS